MVNLFIKSNLLFHILVVDYITCWLQFYNSTSHFCYSDYFPSIDVSLNSEVLFLYFYSLENCFFFLLNIKLNFTVTLIDTLVNIYGLLW
jgi:hypothetical protein